MLKLKDAHERKKISLRKHLDKEKRFGFHKMMMANRCNMVEDLA